MLNWKKNTGNMLGWWINQCWHGAFCDEFKFVYWIRFPVENEKLPTLLMNLMKQTKQWFQTDIFPIKDSISQKLSPDWQMRSSLIAPCLARRQQAGDDGILRIANHLPDGKIVKLCCWRCWFQPAFPHLSAIFRLDQTAERLELYRNARWV